MPKHTKKDYNYLYERNKKEKIKKRYYMNKLAVTFYTSDRYDNNDDDREIISPKITASLIKEWRKESMDGMDVYLGINSNSFNEPNCHNIFCEWDGCIPEVALNYFQMADKNKILVRTAHGYHMIIEHSLSLDDLNKIQKDLRCCRGFVNASSSRNYACLRVSHKEKKSPQIIAPLNYPNGYYKTKPQIIYGDLIKNYLFLLRQLSIKYENIYCDCGNVFHRIKGKSEKNCSCRQKFGNYYTEVLRGPSSSSSSSSLGS